MPDEKELLTELMDVFPNVGFVVPYVELKFRLAGKYGPELLDATLEKLVGKEILNKFEFNNSVNYKSKEEIPVSLGGSKSAAGGDSSQQLKDLSEIVMAIGKALGNDSVNALISKYASNYK